MEQTCCSFDLVNKEQNVTSVRKRLRVSDTCADCTGDETLFSGLTR